MNFLFLALCAQSFFAHAQEGRNWQFNFSSRVQMTVADTEFYFERCDLDVCKPIGSKLPRRPKDFKRIIPLITSSQQQFIVDALSNYEVSAKEFRVVTYGISVSPEKLEVHCNSTVARQLSLATARKSKAKKDYVYRLNGQVNDYCQHTNDGTPVRTVDEVEIEVQKLAEMYLAAAKKFSKP